MTTEYGPGFFANLRDGGRRSARIVAPLVMQVVRPRSVVDVGCGIGSWAAAFANLGCDVIGCDGAYTLKSSLDIPESRFIAVDLENPRQCREAVGRSFDMAVSLEVAEHLPELCAEGFVDLLCGFAPVTLFSAAAPNQAGYNHVHRRWPLYWAELFKRRDRSCIDVLRPLFYYDKRIDVWYRQNMLLFIDQSLYDALFERLHELGLIKRALAAPMGFRHPAWNKPRQPAAAATTLSADPQPGRDP